MGGKSGVRKWGRALNNKKNKNRKNKKNTFLISRMALPPAGRRIHFFSILGQQIDFFRFLAKSQKIDRTKKKRILKSRFTERVFGTNGKLETCWRTLALSLELF